ncbi:MAG: DEAD/DEAH box helicase [Acidobacteriota bacterium]|nr:DEAD/DEAH box helicase [Acidobacteriota bacterium]
MSVPSIPAALQWAHPLVQEWFVAKFGTPTEPQEQGWPHILAGRTTLISAPTGSGKTLAAFLVMIDRLVRKALAGGLEDRTEVLYISPLKALGNDIQKNLEAPLGEIMQMAHDRGLLMPVIRTAVRTGDTLQSERRAMLRRPPHILVTTPESFYILLTAESSRKILKDVETVIVDEIHAVADDKRGAHLTLSLERLEALAAKPLTRIGLSATQKPLELVAHFLTGSGRPDPVVVNIGHQRTLDIAIEVPPSELGPVASNDMWGELYDRVVELARQHRSTLLFVNTRRLVERVSHNLEERMGEGAVAAHHGSLSRKLRLEAEKKLKAGEVAVLVATASLELGIDIGFVDLVIHIGTPRSIGGALQRIGRAGHWRGAVPKGRLFPTTRDELVELAATIRAIHQGDLDRLMVPDAPLDILAQQIIAMCAVEEWDEDALFALVRRAHPYRELTRDQFDAILTMVSEGIAARRGQYGAYVHRDKVNKLLRGRRGARLAAITSGGAIPENALFTVIAEPEGTVVGTLDEDFAVESLAGDVVLLGNTSWRIRKIETGRVFVEDAHGAPPGVPFWLGEAPGRTAELSAQIGDLRQEVSDRTPNVVPGFVDQANAEVAATTAWLKEETGVNDAGAEQIIKYVVEGRAILGAVPTMTRVIAERFFDESGGMQLVIHAPFGARINKAWGLALRKKFCRSFNFELQAAATDNGLNISLSDQHSFPLGDVFHFLHPNTLKETLEQAALVSPLFGTRWRWDAGRALALLRFQNGKKVPPQLQRMRADDLLAAAFPQAAACQDNIEGDIEIPAHPLVQEVMKDVLTEAMDLDGVTRVIANILSGAIETLAVDTPLPSVFSHEILNANPYAYLDDAPLEERRARAVEMRRSLPESVLKEVGLLDPAAIAEVQHDAWPEVRDADKLSETLQNLVALPENTSVADHPPVVQMWSAHFERLRADRRATRAHVNGTPYWVAAERTKSFARLFPAARFEAELPAIEAAEPALEDVIYDAIRGWVSHLGPTTASVLARLTGIATSEIEKALLRLEAAGLVLRGNYLPVETALAPSSHENETQWSERRLLARIHRLTVGKLRKQIEPVTAATFMRWLARWQHVAPGSQLLGERGTLEALRQLQGFEISANAWERHVLARRVGNYDPKFLDQLSLTGAVGWGRLSPHPATLEETASGQRRVVPTSVAPITFFIREESDWMTISSRRSDDMAELRGLSQGARDVHALLKRRGASFFADIVRGTGKLKSEVETALWELVAAGLITADSFDNLRALIDPKRRSGQGHGKTSRPRHTSGRWALLFVDPPQEKSKQIEAAARMLLGRYGVVFRDLLARESVVPTWRELLIALRRLEDRGEIRGGRFVTGFTGEQFALPVAVDSLRALRNLEPKGETVTVSAADPLNLVGIIVPGARVPAISGHTVSFKDGVAVEQSDVFAPAAIAAVGD